MNQEITRETLEEKATRVIDRHERLLLPSEESLPLVDKANKLADVLMANLLALELPRYDYERGGDARRPRRPRKREEWRELVRCFRDSMVLGSFARQLIATE